jgi:hypothetical protein
MHGITSYENPICTPPTPTPTIPPWLTMVGLGCAGIISYPPASRCSETHNLFAQGLARKISRSRRPSRLPFRVLGVPPTPDGGETVQGGTSAGRRREAPLLHPRCLPIGHSCFPMEPLASTCGCIHVRMGTQSLPIPGKTGLCTEAALLHAHARASV